MQVRYLVELFLCEMRHKMCAYHIKIWHKQGCAYYQYEQELVAMGMSWKFPYFVLTNTQCNPCG